MLVRRLVDGERVTHSGRFYAMNDALCEPRPVQARLPILIGGSGPTKTLRTTARYADLWNGYGDPAAIAATSAVLRTRCEEIGRPFESIERTVTTHTVVRDTAALAVEAWAPIAERHGLVDRVAADGTGRGLTVGGPPADVAAYLDGYRGSASARSSSCSATRSTSRPSCGSARSAQRFPTSDPGAPPRRSPAPRLGRDELRHDRADDRPVEGAGGGRQRDRLGGARDRVPDHDGLPAPPGDRGDDLGVRLGSREQQRAMARAARGRRPYAASRRCRGRPPAAAAPPAASTRPGARGPRRPRRRSHRSPAPIEEVGDSAPAIASDLRSRLPGCRPSARGKLASARHRATDRRASPGRRRSPGTCASRCLRPRDRRGAAARGRPRPPAANRDRW